MTFLILYSSSFIPRAMVCIDSIKKFHPKAKIVSELLESDVTPGNYIQGFAKKRLKYVKQLLEAGDKEVIIIGADCVLYDRLDLFTSLHSYSDVVLTPHIVNFPPKEKGAQFYQTGHANADLVLFRAGALPALNWLLEQDMIDDKHNGIFYEQTWLSSLPFFHNLTTEICKFPEINYAYFNFHERQLTYDHTYSDCWIVDGHKLAMVQYSGYIDGYPEKISRYYSGIMTDPLILELFKDYQNRIDKYK